MSQLFLSDGQIIIGASVSASVIAQSIQGWFLLRLTGLILFSRGLSGVFSSTTLILQCSDFLIVQLSYLYIDYRKDHGLDYMDLCQQSDVFAF